MHHSIRHMAVLYLLILMSVKMLSVPAFCLEYAVNKDFIATHLCQNKDKPQLHCFGQCHLNKQLAKTHEADNSQSPRSTSSSITVEFCEELTTLHCTPATHTIHVNFPLYSTSLALGHTSIIFHPPAC